MQSWNARFSALQIDYLRSPTFAHPAAFEPPALLKFAIREGRTSELIEKPIAGGNWLPTSDLSDKASQLKALPSDALFRDFCSSLEAELPHRWLSGKAIQICKDASTGKYGVHFAATTGQPERMVTARAVVLATGPVGKWNVPAPFEPFLHTSKLIVHTETLFAESKGGLSEQIARTCLGESARVLVIGGGISAAQAALAAVEAGHRVVLRSRRPLETRDFDVGSEWLDIRTAARFRFEFLCLPMKKRLEAVRAATPGGSVPASYMEELLRLSRTSSDLQLEVDADIERSHVCEEPLGERVVVNGEAFALVILATGSTAAPSASPLYRSVEEAFGAPMVESFPRVDKRLRWAPGEDLFVLGANAVLELGPGGGNLMGAMRGARVVSNELHDLLRKQCGTRKTGPARPVFMNFYATLGDRNRFGDGSEDEVDVIVQLLNLSPQAETALRKATSVGAKKSKTRLKGQRDPHAAIHLSARERRAAYA